MVAIEVDVVAALAGDVGAATRLASPVPVALSTPDTMPLSDEFLVLDADSSQSYAINAVVAGQQRDEAVGTDAANQMLIPGYGVHREMELLVAAGLTPGEAISAATRNGAQALQHETGMLAAGRKADAILIDLNSQFFTPLEPGNADLHYRFGLYYKVMKQRPRAIAEMRTALRINPRHKPARQELEALSPKDSALTSLRKLFR